MRYKQINPPRSQLSAKTPLSFLHIHHNCSRRLWTFAKQYDESLKIIERSRNQRGPKQWFSFCYNVFKLRMLQRRQKASVSGKGLNTRFNDDARWCFYRCFSFSKSEVSSESLCLHGVCNISTGKQRLFS